MNSIVLATRNLHKIEEIEDIFKDFPIQFLSLSDFQNVPKVIEDGKSFEENAIKKAVQIARWTKKVSLADDSGIEVDFLKGAPGIYSARFAGESATDDQNNQKILEFLTRVPHEKRTARYRCVIAIANAEGKVQMTEGICEGFITTKLQGKKGFGYDPLFFYPPFRKTFGETSPEEKNKVSHRCKALESIKPILLEMLQPKKKSQPK